ncbi:TetR/AcrR family transcriptional regulator [Crocinitomix catalasitica]|uniref:TetR/AcrR family transcriptional regulator n=1 Tax=Crocinitomix catalasitica TaxID=184607 RepID=UPI0012FCBEEE|nr:helix-turn-helix domain-containing protein [Crocinitomix catalasitica]
MHYFFYFWVMSKTREKILRAARLLFNRDGVANVSQRMIANHIAISPGNLTYHFQKRQEIIDALFEEMVDNFEAVKPKGQAVESVLPDLEKWLKAMYKVQFDFRFIPTNFAFITYSNQAIKKAYAKLAKARGEVFNSFIDVLISENLMRDQELTNEYELFLKRFQLLSDHWVLNVQNIEEEVSLKHTREYTQNVMQSLYPYLTEKGKKKFNQLA